MAAAMLCNQAIQALTVDDYGVQRRAAWSNLMRRRFPGLPRVEMVSSSEFGLSGLLAFLLPVLVGSEMRARK